MRSRSLLLAAVAALAGCSLSLKTDKLDPLKDAKGYCDVLFDEMLRLETRCHPATQQLVDIQYAQFTTGCAGLGALEGSTVTYDEDAGRAFITTVQNASCADDLDVLFNDAGAAFHGNVRDGGACSDNIECADRGAECRTPDAMCPGQCLTPGHLNDRCDNGYPQCDVGYYCNSGYCEPAIPAGNDCTSAGNACGSGSYCYYTGVTNVCEKYVAEGGSCNSADDKQCDPDGDRPGLFCDDVSGGAPTCKRIGSVTQGQRCKIANTWDGPKDVCDGWTFCQSLEDPSAVNPVCKLKYGSSSYCFGDFQCMSPLACIDEIPGVTGGTCGSRRNIGETCTAGSHDCVGGADCDSIGSAPGTCTALPSAVGAMCGSPGSLEYAGCLVGWCDATPGYFGSCRSYLDAGTACTGDYECGANGPFSGRCEWTGSGNVCMPGSCLNH